MLNVKKDEDRKIIKKEHRIKFNNNDLLYKYIKKIIIEDDIDFVAFAISHWHAVGVDSAVYDISKRKNKELKGLIIICAHSKGGFVIKEKDFICKNFAKVEFCFLDSNLNNLQNKKFIIFRTYKNFKRLINILKVIIRIRKVGKNKKWDNKKELIIISVMNPMINFLRIFRNESINKKYLPMFSLIEEGVGTYASKKAWKIVRNMDNQNKKQISSSLIKNLELKAKEAVSNLLKKIALKYVNTERRFLLNKKSDSFIPNWEVINSYKNIFIKRSRCFKNIKELHHPIIIVTNPYSEYKLTSLEYELNILDKVTKFVVAKGFSVVIKPHPRETPNKYLPILAKYKSKNVKLIQKDFPIEDLFLLLEPLCIIGYNSTALINADIIFNIPAISISRLFLSNASEEMISKLLKRSNENVFEKLSKDMRIYNVDNFEKLEDILNLIIFKSK